MKKSLFLMAATPLLIPGCAATEFVSRNLPSDTTDNIHIYSRNEETSLNLIDRALANCPDETEQAETACVKEALSSAPINVGSLAAMIPGCSFGSICNYDHTTKRRLGLLPIYATVVKKDWRVSIDLRSRVTVVALLPVAVTDRNVFVVSPSAVTKAAQSTTAVR